MKQACAEAAPKGGVKEFEVGVFCGKYQTAIPEGYFDHLDEVRGKKRKTNGGEDLKGALKVSGPVNGSNGGSSFTLEIPVNALPKNADPTALLSVSNAPRSPDNREDIRLVPQCSV